jgi:hypothetical protein
MSLLIDGIADLPALTFLATVIDYLVSRQVFTALVSNVHRQRFRLRNL